MGKNQVTNLMLQLGIKLRLIVVTCLIIASANAKTSEGLNINATVVTQYDDNILRSNEELSDVALKIAPLVSVTSLYGKHQFSLLYQGTYAKYSENNDLSYDDHSVKLIAKFDHSLRLKSEFRLTYQDKVEDPGTTNSVTQSTYTQYNQYSLKTAQAKFSYGRNKSAGKFEAYVNTQSKEFGNNNQEYRNVDIDKIVGTFFLNIAPKTRMLFEAIFAKNDYITPTVNNDKSSDETFYLAGVNWEASGKTSGTAKIGYQNKVYDSENFNKASGLSYFLNLVWQPSMYTSISFDASRESKDSARLGIGGFLSTYYSASAEYAFSDKITLTSQYSLTSDDITSSLDSDVKRKSLNIGFQYSAFEWMELGFNYRNLHRKSDLNILNFDANIFELSFRSTFK